eukprot:augustus_masked-scaffold_19-processed-gene-4.33-mRNA-1 protein AED:0.02 eAED:0.02 QI:0/-1/0/1/-1/1/1/0/661
MKHLFQSTARLVLKGFNRQNNNFIRKNGYIFDSLVSKQRLFSSLAAVEAISPSASTIRNIAIVAHVDHGKTTLVDALLQTSDSSLVLNNQTMDSNPLEKERGITILSKVTSLEYKDHKINLVDTPGHSDFSGEVESALNLVDGLCLLVDARDGIMPTTKYVLNKAVKSKKKIMVVVNKVDAVEDQLKISQIEDDVLEMLLNFDAAEELMDFKVFYASGKNGWAVDSVEKIGQGKDMKVLLDAFLDEFQSPEISNSEEFTLLASILHSDPTIHKGNFLVTGKVNSGIIKPNDKIKVLSPFSVDKNEKEVDLQTVLSIYSRIGTNYVPLEEAKAGDIVTISGLESDFTSVLYTLCSPSITKPLETPQFDPPTISLMVRRNDGPLSGDKKLSKGTKLTTSLIKERLFEEKQRNAAINVIEREDGQFEVYGRGEMHLGVLIENMRREGFEVCVSKPKVVIKDGKEPIEEVEFLFEEDFTGLILEEMGSRQGECVISDSERFVYDVPTRFLFGLRGELSRRSGGTVLMNSVFKGYKKISESKSVLRKGVMVSNADGVAKAYALGNLEKRGVMFVKPGDRVYIGMIVGELNQSNDLNVSVTKEKKLTNVRAAGKDEMVRLSPVREFMLEDCIGYVDEDELIEVTPERICLRKLELNPSLRKVSNRKR